MLPLTVTLEIVPLFVPATIPALPASPRAAICAFSMVKSFTVPCKVPNNPRFSPFTESIVRLEILYPPPQSVPENPSIGVQFDSLERSIFAPSFTPNEKLFKDFNSSTVVIVLYLKLNVISFEL